MSNTPSGLYVLSPAATNCSCAPRPAA